MGNTYQKSFLFKKAIHGPGWSHFKICGSFDNPPISNEVVNTIFIPKWKFKSDEIFLEETLGSLNYTFEDVMSAKIYMDFVLLAQQIQ